MENYMDKLEKLKQAKELLLQVENEFIREKSFCPYEIGFCIRTLNEAIDVVEKADTKE